MIDLNAIWKRREMYLTGEWIDTEALSCIFQDIPILYDEVMRLQAENAELREELSVERANLEALPNWEWLWSGRE